MCGCHNMTFAALSVELKTPARLFSIGWGIVLLTLWIGIGPSLNTFIHMWKVETVASFFLILTLGYLTYQQRDKTYQQRDKILRLNISQDEIKLLVLPVSLFIAWSTISICWAPSWKSTLHHTLLWMEYLVFYLIIRQVIDRKRGYSKILTVLAVVFLLLAFPAITEYCAFLVFGGGTSLGIRYAKFGEQINTIFPLLMVGVLRLSGKRFALGLISVGAMWLLVFTSLSRINLFLFVGGTIAIATVVFILKRFHQYRRKMLVVLGVLIFAPVPLHLFSLLSEEANVPMVSRIKDEAGISRSNNFRKLMTSMSVEMFKAHPLIGIGADNFGMQVNNYRSVYGERNPTDINLAAAENEIPERSHNEYLQILAELGIIGSLIFLWFLGGIMLMLFKAFRHRTPMIPLAAIIGICLFLVSSLVSSYSFRFIQNGFVFFFVLAVAAKFLLRPRKEQPRTMGVSARQMKLACAFGIVACLGLASYSIIRVSSVIYTERANSVAEIEEATPLYQAAFRLDDENPNPHFYLGHRLFRTARYDEAAAHWTRAIEMGQAGSPTFSYLATAQLLSGDSGAAEATFAKAVTLYPQSPFVLTRYAYFLRMNGKTAEAAAQFERALTVNRSASITWWTILNEGARRASDNAEQNKTLDRIMDLTPNEAIYAVIAERELQFPDEKHKPVFENVR